MLGVKLKNRQDGCQAQLVWTSGHVCTVGTGLGCVEAFVVLCTLIFGSVRRQASKDKRKGWTMPLLVCICDIVSWGGHSSYESGIQSSRGGLGAGRT